MLINRRRLTALTLALFSAAAAAQLPAGEVVRASGEVHLERGSQLIVPQRRKPHLWATL